MQTYGIGLVGWGTVGGGVIELLARDSAKLSERCGLQFELKTVVTRNPERARGQTTAATVTTDLDVLLQDDSIETVLHLVGGTDVAKDILLACVKAGKHVVTANKALVAEHWDEIFPVAAEHGVSIAFEAAVAGSIPIIGALRDGLVANGIDAIQGILNGTCNYILTQMEENGLDYAVALQQAQELGYAEADPTLDVDGTDTAHKLAILARIAGMAPVPFEKVSIEGIESITAHDIASAHRLHCRIKLLGVVQSREDGLELRVAPTLVPLDHPIASVGDNYNAVRVVADAAGPTLLVGQGAGAHPTASAVLADLVDIASGRYQHTANRFRFFNDGEAAAILDENSEMTASYARFTVVDQPGVLAVLTKALGDAGVSILSVIQAEPSSDGKAIVEITTHPAKGADFFTAMKTIDASGLIVAPTVVLRRLTN